MVTRKSPKQARDSNPENEKRKATRKHHKMLGVPKGKTPYLIKHEYKEGKATGKKSVIR